MLRLEVHHKSGAVTVFESEKPSVFLGRDRSMDLVLEDPLVSRQHAVIICRGGECILQDLGGRNPIRLNGKEVISQVLSPGDRLEMGETAITFKQTGSNGAAPAVPDSSPTVVDARRSLARLGERGEWGPAPDETVAGGLVLSAPRADEGRSRRNLRILRSFSELMRNLSDRQKLLETALDTVFDNLQVKRCFIGFFAPDGALDIRVDRDQGPAAGRSAGSASVEQRARRETSYSRSMVDRVRREAVAILFAEGADELGGVSSLLDSKSIVRLNIKSAMCLPLFREDAVIGVLYLDNRDRSESFAQDDLYFANILSHLISLALEKEDLYQRMQEENTELKTILHHKNRLIGVSPAAKEVQRKIKRVSGFDTTVLILGESGTGKELVARAIHDRSQRRAGPFVAVNCAAIPETLLESELFGYAPKSGISGSDPKGKPGKFEQASGGTLFLDEIGDMSLPTQAKILRVLEDKIVTRLGGMEGILVDVRIVAATNKVLEEVVSQGGFREDLYYRLRVFRIDLPPLRERREDILPLCQHFLSLYETDTRGPLELSPRARELLSAYHWAGNIRELKNCIEESVLLSSGRMIYPEHLPADLRRDDLPQPFCALAALEAQHIGRVLQSVNWNKRRAAEILGINRSTLYEKIRLYAIEKPKEAGAASAGLEPAAVEAGAQEELAARTTGSAALAPEGPAAN